MNPIRQFFRAFSEKFKCTCRIEVQMILLLFYYRIFLHSKLLGIKPKEI
jgi:hypothetical protein